VTLRAKLFRAPGLTGESYYRDRRADLRAFLVIATGLAFSLYSGATQIRRLALGVRMRAPEYGLSEYMVEVIIGAALGAVVGLLLSWPLGYVWERWHRRRRGRATPLAIALLSALAANHARAQTPAPATPPAAAQNPSPMLETTRAHVRLTPQELGGTSRTFAGPGGKPVDIWIPDVARARDEVDLVVHFLGAAWLPEQAVAKLGDGTVAAVVNLGAGSGVYHRAFSDPAAFDSLLDGITREVAAVTQRRSRVRRLTLAGFSAGHGAIRAILREPRHFARVNAVLLLDGMHTSYIPDGTVLAAGGAVDSTNLLAFTDFARAAMRGEKRFLVTHSEIFPGTFVSTTETADWILRALGLRRTAVLEWGPRGMQQLSEAHAGRFEVLGFAGNTAPDHIDQLHAMPEMLARLLRP
jgi:hypothetical protein